MMNARDQHIGINFRIEFLIGIIAGYNWLRIFLLLTLTKRFGPMITIFLAMGEDLSKFFVLWGLILVAFSSAGFFIFSELDSFTDLYSTFKVFFGASLGKMPAKYYQGFYLGSEVGGLYHYAVIIVNMLLMLNVVISILSETYSRLSPQKLGLYYDSLIASLPALAND